MYKPSRQNENELAITDPSAPDLIATDPFCRLITTLPIDSPVPMSIIKLGLLTNHLKPKPEGVVADLNAIDIDATRPVAVPSETRSSILWLLSEHCESLSQRRKRKVGRLCEAASLNGPTQNDVALSDTYAQHPSSLVQRVVSKYTCKHCGDEFKQESDRDDHLANCSERPNSVESDSESSSSTQRSSSDRPALGKEIRTDRGTERVSGRNPFNDPDRIKDTGLHQGGG
jgi:hypothetical protein